MSTLTKVFLTFTILLFGCAGFLAYKNDVMFKEEIASRESEFAAMNTANEDLNQELAKEERLKSEIAGVEDEITGLTADQEQQQQVNDGLEEAFDDKTRRVERINADSDMMAAREEEVRKIVQLADQLTGLKGDIEELTAAINETQGNLDDTTAADEIIIGKLTTLKTKFRAISNARSLDELKTSISSIYPTWGFVTLTHGDRAGVVDNSPLEIVRNGEVIGKLLVTSVEEHSASASIVPGSLAEDVTLMQGDQVLPASITKSSTAPGKGAAMPVINEEPPMPDDGGDNFDAGDLPMTDDGASLFD